MLNRWEPRRTLAGIAAAAAMVCVSAQAGAATITFEDADLGPYVGGDTLVEGEFQLAVSDFMAVVDTNAACGAMCGLGNGTRFYHGLTDSRATLSMVGGGVFRLAGFDASYIPVMPQAFADAGYLQLRAITAGGDVVNHSFSFGLANANGAFAFNTFGSWAQPLAGLGAVTSVEFFACTWSSDGSCANPNGYTAQFALDNIRVAAVPEPASVLLMALGVAGLLAGSRRRKA